MSVALIAIGLREEPSKEEVYHLVTNGQVYVAAYNQEVSRKSFAEQLSTEFARRLATSNDQSISLANGSILNPESGVFEASRELDDRVVEEFFDKVYVKTAEITCMGSDNESTPN